MMLADVFDLLAKVNSKRAPAPYPRPWQEANRVGGTNQDQNLVRARLDQMNPKEPDGN